MHMLMIAVFVKSQVALAPVAATCGAPRDIGGGMTVRTCEIVKGGR
jgi:hypothetical protein